MKIYRSIIIVLTIILFSNISYAQKGHHIAFEIKNYESKEIIIAYHSGDKQFILDTLVSTNPGYFLAKGEEELDAGMYIAYLVSTGKSFDFLVNRGEQNFKLTTDHKSLISSMEVNGSNDNKRFYGYLNFLSEQRAKLNKTNDLLEDLKKNKEVNKDQIEELEKKVENLDKGVVNYQKELIYEYPNSFTAAIIKVNTPINVPEEIRKNEDNGFYYYKEHFFDNTNLTDERFLRSSFLHPKIDYYIGEMTIQHPDSVIASVDRVLKLSEGNDKIYQFVLARLLNRYAKTKLVCMDAVYVHLVDNYYSNGKADWIEKEQLVKMQESANEIRPILCNRVAPDIDIQTVNDPNQRKSLHKINSKYTVLFMWNYDADFITELMPDMIKFYDDFKSQGVELFSICTNSRSLDKTELLEFIDNNGMNRWQNYVDWDNSSNYKQDYRLLTSLSIFLLDENKKILSKRIDVDQLTDVMNNVLKSDR